MDKSAERLTREKQFRVRVPIEAIFITTLLLNSKSTGFYSKSVTVQIKLLCLTLIYKKF